MKLKFLERRKVLHKQIEPLLILPLRLLEHPQQGLPYSYLDEFHPDREEPPPPPKLPIPIFLEKVSYAA